MVKVTVIKMLSVTAMAVTLGFTSCKDANEGRQDNNDIQIIGDSISPTGSDGLGREIDTVQQINRLQNDTIVTTP